MLELEKKNSPPIVERYGPIYYEFPHLNGFPEVHAFYVSIVKGPYPGIKYLSASLADRRYFMKLKETSEEFSAERNKFDNRNMTIYEPLMKRGIFYWHQSVTSFYSVLDLAYYADLATVVDCYKRRPFLPRKAVLTQKSSLLDLILWNCWTHERVYLKMTEVQAKAGRLPSPLYSFIARSYPSLLYLPFNSSVWRTEKPAHFLGTRFGKGGIYKEFEEIKAELPTDKLEEIFKGRILRQEDWGKYD
jgi:hypothetical protein